MAIELLQVLSVQSMGQWHDIVTLDESWIYLVSEHDLIWTAPGEIVVDMERHTVQSPKFMLTVVWNTIGFHVLKALPKGRKSKPVSLPDFLSGNWLSQFTSHSYALRYSRFASL
jgi:hypothetical protein